MRPFEYARPQSEAEAAVLLNDHAANTAVLAGGTDLMNLLRRDLVAPQRVVDLKNVPSLREIAPDSPAGSASEPWSRSKRSSPARCWPTTARWPT